MLTVHETATIRAALRYWADEMADHQDTAQFYFDSDETQQLTSVETRELSKRLNDNAIRFLADGSTKLLTRAEAERIPGCRFFATAILGRSRA